MEFLHNLTICPNLALVAELKQKSTIILGAKRSWNMQQAEPFMECQNE